MLLVAVVMKLFVSLQKQTAPSSLKTPSGLEGTVYLRIPPLRRGREKVNLLLQERYAE
jgi:hypothetical protein